MSYTEVEQAALTLMQAYQSGAVFTDGNSSRGDYRVLDAQGVTVAAVLTCGGESTYDNELGGYGSQGKTQEKHTVAITLFQEREQGLGGDGATYIALHTLVDGVVDYLGQYPRLGSSAIRYAEITKVSNVVLRQKTPHLYRTIFIDAYQSTTIDWLEDPD